MKTLGKFLLLLSFVVVGRWARHSTPVAAAAFPEQLVPAAFRAPDNGRVLLVRHAGLARAQRRVTNPSVLALF